MPVCFRSCEDDPVQAREALLRLRPGPHCCGGGGGGGYQTERNDEKYDEKWRGLVRVDWNETAEDEDPAILWALKNEKFGIVDILMPVNKINLQGDPSADLTINCDSETFRVHKYFLCSKSPVFRARLERWEREGEININTMNSDTLSSMIHYIYTGELADGWQDLDIQDVTIAADMYDLPGWMKLFQLRGQ